MDSLSRYQLRILEEPPGVFYKDDGGMRNNHMTLRVALMAALRGEGGRITQEPSKHKLNVLQIVIQSQPVLHFSYRFL